MENWDVSDLSIFLSGASLIPPTVNKRHSDFSGVSIFIRTEASLDLKYHPIPSVCRTVWIWMTTNFC